MDQRNFDELEIQVKRKPSIVIAQSPNTSVAVQQRPGTFVRFFTFVAEKMCGRTPVEEPPREHSASLITTGSSSAKVRQSIEEKDLIKKIREEREQELKNNK